MVVVCLVPYHTSYSLLHGVCDVNSDELRQMVADYLEANPSTYCDAVSQPMASHDAYNADTPAPVAEDEFINNVADPKLRTGLGGRNT